MLDISDDVELAARAIVGSLDEDGFFDGLAQQLPCEQWQHRLCLGADRGRVDACAAAAPGPASGGGRCPAPCPETSTCSNCTPLLPSMSRNFGSAISRASRTWGCEAVKVMRASSSTIEIRTSSGPSSGGLSCRSACFTSPSTIQATRSESAGAHSALPTRGASPEAPRGTAAVPGRWAPIARR